MILLPHEKVLSDLSGYLLLPAEWSRYRLWSTFVRPYVYDNSKQSKKDGRGELQSRYEYRVDVRDMPSFETRLPTFR